MFEGILLATAVAASSLTLPQAKVLADLDEASLSAAQNHRLIESQQQAGAQAFSTCASQKPSGTLQPFTIVIELDARGRVQQMWSLGETALARCVERQLAGAVYFQPPKVPFYASFEFVFDQ